MMILNAPLCRILSKDGQHHVFIKMSQGGWLEHEPFDGDLRGLVAAMQLATEVLAGKFFPRGIMKDPVVDHLRLKDSNQP